MGEKMNQGKTLKEASDTELKALLWEIEQRSKPLQEQYQIVLNELASRSKEVPQIEDIKNVSVEPTVEATKTE
jgi:hypothetical protein